MASSVTCLVGSFDTFSSRHLLQMNLVLCTIKGYGESLKEAKNTQLKCWGKKFSFFFSGALSTTTPIVFPFFNFFSRVGTDSSGLVQIMLALPCIALVQCPPSLRVAFNIIISMVQGRQAPTTDLEVTHYRQPVPRRKKNEVVLYAILTNRLLSSFYRWFVPLQFHCFQKFKGGLIFAFMSNCLPYSVYRWIAVCIEQCQGLLLFTSNFLSRKGKEKNE